MLAAGTHVGHFQIQRLLGEGAMGQVYLAQDTTLGRRIALKLIRRSVLQREGAARFLEEARATASLNHPHIVTLHAVGEHEGRPYLALEYVEGGSLRARLLAGRVPVREALGCCRAVADALSEAHRRGIVHADLKPENIVIPDDGRVRVVDFGLARLAGGARLATSGTPAYMAPERWRGAPTTGAIDVWAFGVVMHELLAGRRPISDTALPHLMFAADASSAGLIELPELPDAPWAQIVRDCLALDPALRPSAQQLVRRLGALLEGPAAYAALTEDPATPVAARGSQPVDDSVDPEWRAQASTIDVAQLFEGRRDTVAALIRSGCAALASRTPTLVTVLGEDGIGKTRLAAALHRALAQTVPAARVLALRGQAPATGEMDETHRALLRLLLSPGGLPARPPEPRELLQAEVGEAWPAVALTLGWIERDAPELLPLAQAPGALRLALVEATGRLMRRAAEQAPLCVVIDDAHFADATTLDALELATLGLATLGRTAGAPLWICVLAAPSFDALRPSWGERAERAEVIELAPLPDAAAAELCRTLLHPAENVPEQLVGMITARAQGNAMLLGELCRALKSEGIIRQERTGAWILETDRIDAWPRVPRMQWLAERELRRLPPELVGHAQLAAVLGPKLAVADLIGVIERLGGSPAAPSRALDPVTALARLEAAQLLRVREHHHCEFRNTLLCEVMRAAIPAAQRALLHRAAFEHYRALRQPEERRRPRIAFHAAEAGLREPAAMAYEALAADHFYRHCYVEAEGAYTRMLALVDTAPRRLIALHGRGMARHRNGRYEDALTDLHEARALAGELGDRRAELAILLDEATVADWLWAPHRSAELVAQAEALAGDVAEPVIAARIAMGRARSLWRLGQREEAHAGLLEAVRRAEAAGGGAYESLIASLIMLGDVLGKLGEIREAHGVFERALAMARAQGDRLHEMAALNNRRQVWVAEKDVARAAADLRILLELARGLGTVLVEIAGSFNLGELLYRAGDVAAAWPYVERAVTLAVRRPELHARPLARLLELRLLAYEERWQEALALGAEISELHQAARAEGRTDAELMPDEELLLDAVMLASTGAGAEQWAEVRARSRRCVEPQQWIEVLELQALGALRVGDLPSARQRLEEALGVAREVPNVMEARLRRRLAWIDARLP